MATRDTTFCFTDIAGSTGVLRELGEARYDEVLERHRALIRAALRTAGGREIKTEGDGFFVVFEEAAASLRFAMDAQRALGSENWPVPVRVRMGMHRGPGVVRADGDYSSLAAHQAARVASAAHGGQVLMTADVVRDVDPPEGARLLHLGEHRLRDFDGGVALLQLASAGLADGFPPVRATREDHGLRLPRSSLVGRSQELQLLRELLATTPMVTLHGPGGVGKTRLALEAAAAMAASFPDGLHLVELSTVEPEVVIATVMAAVGGSPMPGQDPLDALVAALSVGTHLLILDSAERVLDPVAQLADAVVRSCSGSTLLITSTEPVRTPDERVVAVAPLPAPDELDGMDAGIDLLASDAVRLLVQRATTRGANVGDDLESARALATIARRLDGIPLALELAAGRIAEVGVDATLDGLDDRFGLLTNGFRTALPRHRTLEAMMAWTVSSLSDDDQALLARLATLRGRWRPEDAIEVCGGSGALHGLVDRSLLSLDDDAEGRCMRLRMFDTVRAYAESHLPDPGTAELLVGKRRWLLAHLREINTGADSRIRHEIDEMLADFREVMVPDIDSDEQTAGDIAEIAAMSSAWFEARGLWEEAIGRLQSAVDLAPHGRQRLVALAALAHHHVLMGDAGRATELAGLVLDDPVTPDTARALAYLAHTPAAMPAPPPGELDPLVEAVRLAGSPTSSLSLSARSRVGLRALALGDPATAVDIYTEVIEVGRAHGRMVVTSQALGNLGSAYLRLGRLDEAEAAMTEARALATTIHLPQVAAVCLTNLSMLALARGDAAKALTLAEDRLRVALRMGDRRGEASAHIAMANAALGLGQRARAKEENRWAYETYHKLELSDGAGTCLFNLVVLADGDGDRAEAARAGVDLILLVTATDNVALHTLGLYAAGGVLARAMRLEAAQLLGAAEAHEPEVGPLDPTDRAWLAECEAALATAFDADSLATARVAGADLDPGTALTLAADLLRSLVV